MPSLGELAAEFEELIKRKKRNTDDASLIAVRQLELEADLLEAMMQNGLQNTKSTTGMTLYHRIDKFVAVAEGYTSEQLALELAQHEQTRDLVAPKFNANSLRSRIKEIEEAGEELPESLARMIKIIEKDRIGHRG